MLHLYEVEDCDNIPIVVNSSGTLKNDHLENLLLKILTAIKRSLATSWVQKRVQQPCMAIDNSVLFFFVRWTLKITQEAFDSTRVVGNTCTDNSSCSYSTTVYSTYIRRGGWIGFIVWKRLTLKTEFFHFSPTPSHWTDGCRAARTRKNTKK